MRCSSCEARAKRRTSAAASPRFENGSNQPAVDADASQRRPLQAALRTAGHTAGRRYSSLTTCTGISTDTSRCSLTRTL